VNKINKAVFANWNPNILGTLLVLSSALFFHYSYFVAHIKNEAKKTLKIATTNGVVNIIPRDCC